MNPILNAKLCHRCNEQYIGKLCPKCTPKAVLRGAGGINTAPFEDGVRRTVEAAGAAATATPKRGMSAPALNKTEQRWQDAHPSHIPFAIRLRWGKTMHYSPDFFSPGVLIEVKGGHIFDRDIVRFKGCAAEWGWLFEFQMWTWKDKKWTRLY